MIDNSLRIQTVAAIMPRVLSRILKKELIYQTDYKSRKEAKTDVEDSFFKVIRRHIIRSLIMIRR